MVLSKTQKIYVYSSILKNLYKGDYLSKATRGLLSEPGGRGFFKKMVDYGYIIPTKNKENKRFATFTDKGKEYLEKLQLNQLNLINKNNRGECDGKVYETRYERV